MLFYFQMYRCYFDPTLNIENKSEPDSMGMIMFDLARIVIIIWSISFFLRILTLLGNLIFGSPMQQRHKERVRRLQKGIIFEYDVDLNIF